MTAEKTAWRSLTQLFRAAGLVGLVGGRKWSHLGAESLPFSTAAAVAAVCTT